MRAMRLRPISCIGIDRVCGSCRHRDWKCRRGGRGRSLGLRGRRGPREVIIVLFIIRFSQEDKNGRKMNK
jgi:hypothetical protein